MNELRSLVLCIERLRSAQGEEEAAEARADLAALESQSVLGALGVGLLRLYVERPGLICLAIVMVTSFLYFTTKSWLH